MNRLLVGLSLLLYLTIAEGGGVGAGGHEGAHAAAQTSAAYPPELQRRLAAALAAKGPDYRPRTEHLLPDGRPRYTNRLILEDSPYLIQHAHNPVDWYAWGPEAFERARRENKPVFLSIGYSTCHWCHVMERESFEDSAIAELLNRHFVAIKVDREVRPDIDQVYMTAVQLLTGTGGWPMSSILTPEGETIVAGTYFPPDDFSSLLQRVNTLWQAQPEQMRARAAEIARAVAAALAVDAQAAELGDRIVDRAVASLLDQHDALQGGFGDAPKFPQQPRLALLLDQALRRDDQAALTAAVFTLQSMARGGIHDQVGGGFHRYAIDNDWLVPHFEKMLYDQAQLARLYLAAWRLTGDPELARVARRTLDFVLRDLTSPAGGFYSATDAESEGEEGLFFLWTLDELMSVLPPEDADLVIALYGVTESGNFEGRNILHLPVAPEPFAAARGLTPTELWKRMDAINERLYRHREERPHPHRDEKILTAWNGMMIAALAEVADALGEPRYLSAAERAAELLWSEQRPAPGRINRVYLDGRTAQPGLLEDYAFLGQAMIALYDATGEQLWLTRAREMAEALWERFADQGEGGLFMGEAAEDTPLMTRPKEVTDGVMPSATSAALQLLAELTRRTDELAYERHASSLLASTSGRVAQVPSAFPALLTALNLMRHGDTGHLQYAARGAVRADARISPRDDGSASLVIELTLRPGWHVNAYRPLQDELIGTTLRTSGESEDWRMATPAYPTPEILRLGFQSEPLAVYQGDVRIETTLAANPQQRADPGEEPGVWLPFELRLQACSDAICLAPETLVLQVPLSFAETARFGTD
ncbi:thioredoxin domain-containing protein [Thiocapsa sp.]|uniref:thioredoxin domain-containing protein n=1 Tax=Thiocapsa sp. TaxID=2024551 RepID=UPI002C7CB59E|nr:DUF255 domain-containing protein [Thiocapsa sp.]HSO83198.1 DUF255 domain-containing protein [Thiocapsa sp.]